MNQKHGHVERIVRPAEADACRDGGHAASVVLDHDDLIEELERRVEKLEKTHPKLAKKLKKWVKDKGLPIFVLFYKGFDPFIDYELEELKAS